MSDNRVTINPSPALEAEFKRLLSITDLGTRREILRRGITLLRIHVDAAVNGKDILLVDAENMDWDTFPFQNVSRITLPFKVSRIEGG